MAPSRARSVARGAWVVLRVMWANPLTFVGFVLVVLLCVGAVLVAGLPPFTHLLFGRSYTIVPYPLTAGQFPPFSPPSLAHPLGTDNLGVDMLSLVLTALPLDLAIGLSITSVALLVGTGLGLVAGFWDTPRTWGGALSVVILRLTDIFLAFPSLILALAIAVSLGRGLLPTFIAITVTWWPYYVRVVRGEVLTIKHQPYVAAARAAGLTERRILGRHIVRNLIEPLLVYFTLDVGTVIVTFSTISYIGIALPPTTPEWGSMIALYEACCYPPYWWTIAAPGLAIFVTVFAFSLLGDGLRDLLDPRSRKALVESRADSTLPQRSGTEA
ncbi:MAG TPA: ABC transporter permease [Thermoplasmata archaeon]|nr:ABC transporter permease [Thermoplasmata archaeon]